MTEGSPSRDMETVLSRVLAGGVLTSFVLILAGFVLAAASGGSRALEAPIVSGNFFEFAGQEISMVLSGNLGPRTLVTLGLLTLLLTPYVRVVSSVVLFGLRERDAKFTLITLFVLAVLTASLALA